MKLGEWYNIRYKQTVLKEKSLLLQGWINGRKIADWIDDGKMTQDITETQKIIGKDDALYFPIKESNQIWTAGAYSGLYIRLTGTVSTQIKNLSVKEF
jgi:hypothetical protein